MHRNVVLLALSLFVFSSQAAIAEAKWSFLFPKSSEPNVYRAFAFAKDNDDRLEIACNKKRIDFFYSASKTVSKSALRRIRTGKPQTLVRLRKALAGIRPDSIEQEGGRLLFITDVKPSLLKDMAGHSTPFIAGIRASGKILSQGLFPKKGLQKAIRGLASGCGF